jgi:hypothetical protein
MSRGYRRAIRITAEPGRATTEVEDDFHHFLVSVEHDGLRVTAVQGQAIRYPWSACPAAAGALTALVGLPVAVDPTAVYRFADPLAQCTHMFEMAGLAVAQAARGPGRRRYDAFVSDAEGGEQVAQLLCDGATALDWGLRDGLIQPPDVHAGKRPADFRSRALASAPAQEAEAVLILRRAVALAASRAMDVDRFANAAELGRPGACFTFQPVRAAGALRRRGSVMDFSAGPGPLSSAATPKP